MKPRQECLNEPLGLAFLIALGLESVRPLVNRFFWRPLHDEL